MQLNVLRFPLGQLQANCYFLISGSQCLIIDPADEASFILEEISRRNLTLVGMIATHGHFDHVMAVGEVQMSYPSSDGSFVPFFLHPEDHFLIKRLGETATYFLGYDPQVIPLQKMESLLHSAKSFHQFPFEVIHTPGHTPGSCCLYFKKEKTIFTGDTLFKGSIGRYDFSYSNKTDLKKSLQLLMKLPSDTIVYSGHGERTTLGEELSLLCHILT